MNISNSCKQTLALSNTAEITENESWGSFTPLLWNDLYVTVYKHVKYV